MNGTYHIAAEPNNYYRISQEDNLIYLDQYKIDGTLKRSTLVVNATAQSLEYAIINIHTEAGPCKFVAD
jgi:hypothetical protein